MYRSQEAGEAEIVSLTRSAEEGKARAEELNQEIQEADADIRGLQTEKDLQSGGQVKELAESADALSKRWLPFSLYCRYPATMTLCRALGFYRFEQPSAH